MPGFVSMICCCVVSTVNLAALFRARRCQSDNVGPRCDDGCSCCALALRGDKTSQRARCTSRLDVFFSFWRARNALTDKHNHMHITMHANLQKMLHMVPHGTKHHLATARLVAWVEWKLS